MHLGPESVTLEVLTFREGVLSAVGHDLLLRAERLDVEVDAEAGRVRARIDPRGLRVLTALVGGREAPGALSPRDVADIERHLQHHVLESERYPDIHFASQAVGPEAVEGQLTLHGQTRPLSFPYSTQGRERRAELTLDQRDWGIRPYRAMLGSLRVRPELQVRVRLVLPG